MLALWDEVDVLLTPGLATHRDRRRGRLRPLRADRVRPRGAVHAVDAVFNVTGQPAIALPAGFGADGLPLSVQLVGRPGAEDVLYSLAGQIEAARPWGTSTVLPSAAEQLFGELAGTRPRPGTAAGPRATRA